ncbi:MAG: uL15 family ribosomal protein [archaeon]
MRVHKRKKSSRIRGGKTCGWGFRQKHKGHGNKGGTGMAGSGKRADHKKQSALMSDEKGQYFGKQGATSRGTKKKKYEKINLCDIRANFDGNKIDLSKHKILGKGEGFKAEILAKSASVSAIEKMEKAGGRILIVNSKKSGVRNQVSEEN